MSKFPFTRKRLLDLPPSRAGVYALWSAGSRCLYVGMSRVCIRRRLLEHRRGSGRQREATRFEFLITSPAVAAPTEREWVSRRNPTLNQRLK